MVLLLLLFCTCLGSVVLASKEVEFGIYPSKISYLEQENPCFMLCATGQIDIESIQWITITKNFKPMVSLLAGDEFEWGSNYRDESERIRLNGSLINADQAFLRLDFDYVKCEDEARYQCIIEGYDKNGVFRNYKMSEEMLIYSTHGKPTVTAEKPYTALNHELDIMSGIDLTLKCEGPAGKPPAPLYWLKYNPYTDTYQKETDLVVGEASLTLPLNDLCRYHRNQTLKYTTRASEPEVRFKCQLGYYEQTFYIRTEPYERRFSEGSWRIVRAGIPINGCREVNMKHVFVTMVAILTLVSVLV